LEVDGRHMTVMHDFASSLGPGDAVKDIMTLVSAVYHMRKVQLWVTADSYEQQGRVALMDALKATHIPIQRAGYITTSRGCLSELLRTSLTGRRMLTVEHTCKATLNALASGYRQSVGRDGRAVGEPEKNQSRTLMEALETLVQAINAGAITNQLPEGFGATRNAQGVGYLSALRR